MNDPGIPTHSHAEIVAPFAYEAGHVPPEWIDHNGHMNVLHYLEASERATAAFYEFLGIGSAYRTAQSCGLFAAEHHIVYRAELREADPIRVTSTLLDVDEKRMHFVNCLHRGADQQIAAAIEHVELHVDLTTRRVAPFRPSAMERLRTVREAHARLPPLPEISRRMGLRRRRTEAAQSES